jgi:predicted nucleotidyltransferase
MLQQEAMIERTRRICREDERLAAAMMYGSFAQGEGDGFSDIEFILLGESLWRRSARDIALDRRRHSSSDSIGAVPRPAALLAWRDREA